MPRFLTAQGLPTTLNPAWVAATMPALDPKGTPIIGITSILLGLPGTVTINVRGSQDDVDTALGLRKLVE
jgi:hypothetical protein